MQWKIVCSKDKTLEICLVIFYHQLFLNRPFSQWREGRLTAIESEAVDFPAHLSLQRVTAAKGWEEAYPYIYRNLFNLYLFWLWSNLLKTFLKEQTFLRVVSFFFGASFITKSTLLSILEGITQKTRLQWEG